MLKKQYCLKDRQEKQRNCRVDALPALRSARLDRVALLFADIAEANAVSGKVQNITVANNGACCLHLFAVDPNSALGEDVENAPYSLGASDEYRVHSADRCIRQAYIRRF